MKRYSVKTRLLVFASTAILAACAGEESKQTTHADPVTVELSRPVKIVSNAIHASGQVESSKSAIISTRVMGYITSIMVKPGDRVRQGQLMITLNGNDVLAKKGQARAMVVEAEAALKDAQKDVERYTQLYQQQSATAKELENITLHYQSIKSKAEAANQMQREAEAMLTYTNIAAPFSGIVTHKYINEGSLANPGMPLLVVEQQEAFRVTTSIDESEIGNVSPGVDAKITLKSNGRRLQGRVSEISPSANPVGRYSIKVSLSGVEAKDLYSGMHVNVEIPSAGAGESEEKILVPYDALVHKDQLTGIYTVSENNTALLRWITAGRTYGKDVEVLSGINENESFILSADGKLYNGIPVHSK